MGIENDLQNALSPFANIAKAGTVEIDLHKVAQSVAKSVAETPVVSIQKAEDVTKMTDPLLKNVESISAFLDTTYLDHETGRVYCNSSEPLARVFEMQKDAGNATCQKCGMMKSMCKCMGKSQSASDAEQSASDQSQTDIEARKGAFPGAAPPFGSSDKSESEASDKEARKASAKKFKKTATRDDTMGSTQTIDDTDPNKTNSDQFVTTAMADTQKDDRPASPGKDLIEDDPSKLTPDGFKGGVSPARGKPEDQYTTRGAGEANDGQQVGDRYTAGSGIANDKDPKFQYTNHEPDASHDKDFDFNQPPQEGSDAAKRDAAKKAQYDGISETMGAVDQTDRKKPYPTQPNQPAGDFDAGKQSVDTLDQEGQKRAAATQKDAADGDPASASSESEMSESEMSDKEARKREAARKGQPVETAKAEDDNAPWPKDMAPAVPPTRKAERLTRGERPIPARDSRKINKRYDEKRDRAFGRTKDDRVSK